MYTTVSQNSGLSGSRFWSVKSLALLHTVQLHTLDIPYIDRDGWSKNCLKMVPPLPTLCIEGRPIEWARRKGGRGKGRRGRGGGRAAGEGGGGGKGRGGRPYIKLHNSLSKTSSSLQAGVRGSWTEVGRTEKISNSGRRTRVAAARNWQWNRGHAFNFLI